jgi:hypothetical protein
MCWAGASETIVILAVLFQGHQMWHLIAQGQARGYEGSLVSILAADQYLNKIIWIKETHIYFDAFGE